MTPTRVPRRLRALALGVAVGAVFAAGGWSARAWADRPTLDQRTDIEDRNRETSARTTVGAPGAALCSAAAVAGVSDDEAVAACDRAINSERLNRANRIATHLNRGTIHMRRSEGAAALLDFEAVTALQPNNGEAHLNRGAALIMTGQPGPAVAAITTALSLGVREPHKAYYNRAAAREALGDIRGAYEDYSTALAIVPDWGPAEAELARFVRGRRELLAERLGDAPAPAETQTQAQ